MAPAGFQHVAGETLFFSCRVAGYAKPPEEEGNLVYSVQSFDTKGVPLNEIYKNELVTDVTPQDKEWMPKISTEIQIPPLVAAGTYKILIKVEDMVAKTNAELSVPFEVRSKTVEPSDTLVTRNFQFFRGEEDPAPLQKPVYRGGDAVWTKFDIRFKYGGKDHVDVSYVPHHRPAGRCRGRSPSLRWSRAELHPKRCGSHDGAQSAGEHQARRLHNRGHHY
jgi:hypothetical protein